MFLRLGCVGEGSSKLGEPLGTQGTHIKTSKSCSYFSAFVTRNRNWGPRGRLEHATNFSDLSSWPHGGPLGCMYALPASNHARLRVQIFFGLNGAPFCCSNGAQMSRTASQLKMWANFLPEQKLTSKQIQERYEHKPK